MHLKPIFISSEERLRFDSVRGFLCFAAFFFHLYKGPISSLSSIYKERFKMFFLEGYAGVNVFFAISGFLLLNSILHLKQNYPNSFIRVFYFKRIFRTVPTWFIALLIYTILFVDVPEVGRFLWNFFFIFAWKPFQFKDILVVQSWTLFLEELYYLIFPVLFLFFRKKYLIGGFVFYSVINALIKRLVFVPEGYVFFHLFGVFRFFVIGILYFLFLEELKKIKSDAIFYMAFFLIFLGSLFSNKVMISESYCLFWLYFIFSGPEKFSYVFNLLFSSIGKMCYSYYLIHFIFVTKFKTFFDSELIQSLNLNFDFKVLITVGLSFIASFIAAAILYQCVELPFIKLGQRLFKAQNN